MKTKIMRVSEKFAKKIDRRYEEVNEKIKRALGDKVSLSKTEFTDAIDIVVPAIEIKKEKRRKKRGKVVLTL